MDAMLRPGNITAFARLVPRNIAGDFGAIHANGHTNRPNAGLEVLPLVLEVGNVVRVAARDKCVETVVERGDLAEVPTKCLAPAVLEICGRRAGRVAGSDAKVPGGHPCKLKGGGETTIEPLVP